MSQTLPLQLCNLLGLVWITGTTVKNVHQKGGKNGNHLFQEGIKAYFLHVSDDSSINLKIDDSLLPGSAQRSIPSYMGCSQPIQKWY